MQDYDQICEVGDAYRSLPLPKPFLGNIASIKKDGIALAKHLTKNKREVLHVGQVQDVIIVGDDTEYEIMFMRRTSHSGFPK